MDRIMQNAVSLSELQIEFAERLEIDEIIALSNHIKAGALRVRNKAVAILAFNKSLSMRPISRFLLLDMKTVSHGGISFEGAASTLSCRPNHQVAKSLTWPNIKRL
jgi:hypothetical protein